MAFVVFGLGALAVAFVIIPVLRLGAHGRGDPSIRVQAVVHHAFRLFEWFLSVLGLIRVSRVGFERLRGTEPRLVIANHPTLIDVVLVGASFPQADCVVKRAAWRNRYLRGVVTLAGYVANDEGNKLVEVCVSHLRRGRTLLMFPEGTRSPRGRLGRIQRGAAHVALRSGVPLLPIVITCDPPTLWKGQPWHAVPDRTPQITLIVQPAIDPAAYTAECESVPLAARRLSREIEAVFLGRPGKSVDGSRSKRPTAAAQALDLIGSD